MEQNIVKESDLVIFKDIEKNIHRGFKFNSDSFSNLAGVVVRLTDSKCEILYADGIILKNISVNDIQVVGFLVDGLSLKKLYIDNIKLQQENEILRKERDIISSKYESKKHYYENEYSKHDDRYLRW